MGRTAVNFTFDIPDININTVSKSSIAKVESSELTLIDDQSKPIGSYTHISIVNGLFQYETNQYTVPAGKRLIFRVSLNLSALDFLIHASDTPVTEAFFFHRLPFFSTTFCRIDNLFSFGMTKAMGYAQQILKPASYCSPTLIAKENQIVKICFDWTMSPSTRPDRQGMNNSDYLRHEQISSLNRIITNGFRKKAQFALVGSVLPTYDNVLLASNHNVFTDKVMLTPTIYRFGTPEIAFLEGFLEDDI